MRRENPELQLDSKGYPVVTNPRSPYFGRQWRRPPERARQLVEEWERQNTQDRALQSRKTRAKRKRHLAWWNSLSPDEKRQYRERKAALREAKDMDAAFAATVRP